MGRIGMISSIKKDYSQKSLSMESSLARNGYSRMPGTGDFKTPFKEISGKYRTGLDPDAAYIRRISDKTERDIEIKRVNDLRARLETALNVELHPTSKFWNHALATHSDDMTHVHGYKLTDGDNVFDLSSDIKLLTYTWLSVHPAIASSLEAYYQGLYPSETKWYVADEEAEAKVTYKKKSKINNAIIKFSQMTPDKRKKVARLLGLPVDDNAKEEIVYNLVDQQLKETEFKGGEYRGLTPVEIFTRFADMKENVLHIKDVVRQCILHSILRNKQGRIFEGENEMAKDEDELVKFLADDDHQEDLIILEQKLRAKKATIQ